MKKITPFLVTTFGARAKDTEGVQCILALEMGLD